MLVPKRNTMKSKSAKNTKGNQAETPSVKEVQEFFYLKGLSAVETWQFYNYYQLRHWKNSKRKPISNWKLAAARWAEMICTRYPYLISPEIKQGKRQEERTQIIASTPQILIIISSSAVCINSCQNAPKTG